MQAQPALLRALQSQVPSAVATVQPPESPLFRRRTLLRCKVLAFSHQLPPSSESLDAEPLHLCVQEANVLRKAHRIRVLGADIPAPLKVLLSPSAYTAPLGWSCAEKSCTSEERLAACACWSPVLQRFARTYGYGTPTQPQRPPLVR